VIGLLSNCRRWLSLVAAFTLTATLLGEIAAADGGRLVRIERTQGWIVSIFVTPDPPRVGPLDVSVLVQDGASGQVVADAEIAVTLTLQTDHDLAISAPVSRRQATNKLLQSALLEVASPGDWQGIVHCRAGDRTAEIPFALQVAEAPPTWSKLALWFLWPIAAALLFVAHRAIGRQRTLSSYAL
jgi:hypothetical protein